MTMDALAGEPTAAISAPGVYPGLSRAQYEAIDAANNSKLKLFERTAAHAREGIVKPRKPTAAMEMGQAVHVAVLEPERFAAEYTTAPKVDRRTSAGKAEWAAFEASHPGRNYLTPEELTSCQGMQAAILANGSARELLYGPGHNELSFVWHDEATGALCKGRLDRFTSVRGYSFIVDLKKSIDASVDGFSKQAARLDYHVQAAFYLDGMEAIKAATRRFVMVAVEPEPPYGVCCYELGDNELAAGRAAYRKWLHQYVECQKTGVWPGYDEGIIPLSFPKWKITEAE